MAAAASASDDGTSISDSCWADGDSVNPKNDDDGGNPDFDEVQDELIQDIIDPPRRTLTKLTHNRTTDIIEDEEQRRQERNTRRHDTLPQPTKRN